MSEPSTDPSMSLVLSVQIRTAAVLSWGSVPHSNNPATWVVVVLRCQVVGEGSLFGHVAKRVALLSDRNGAAMLLRFPNLKNTAPIGPPALVFWSQSTSSSTAELGGLETLQLSEVNPEGNIPISVLLTGSPVVAGGSAEARGAATAVTAEPRAQMPATVVVAMSRPTLVERIMSVSALR